jgi:hypothetical protein
MLFGSNSILLARKKNNVEKLFRNGRKILESKGLKPRFKGIGFDGY